MIPTLNDKNIENIYQTKEFVLIRSIQRIFHFFLRCSVFCIVIERLIATIKRSSYEKMIMNLFLMTFIIVIITILSFGSNLLISKMPGAAKTVYNIVLIIIDLPVIPFIVALRILNIRFRMAEKNIVCSLSEKYQINENIKLTGICVLLISSIFSITVITNIYNSYGDTKILYDDRVNIGYLAKHFAFFLALLWTVWNYKTLFNANVKVPFSTTKDYEKNQTTLAPKNIEQDQYFEILHKQQNKAFDSKRTTTNKFGRKNILT
uniref:G_PROTEIN_RECEP_F1_2 domain-containing protein n=1 Tax=Strongyloides papillosus TaxID=174720 RepID=A0A0N5BV95_STREA